MHNPVVGLRLERNDLMRRPCLLIAAMLVATTALAGPLLKGAVVRVQIGGLGTAWHEGKITSTSAGCTMVALDKPTPEGYTLIALIGLTHVERKAGAVWSDVPLGSLTAQEPKPCLQEGAD